MISMAVYLLAVSVLGLESSAEPTSIRPTHQATLPVVAGGEALPSREVPIRGARHGQVVAVVLSPTGRYAAIALLTGGPAPADALGQQRVEVRWIDLATGDTAWTAETAAPRFGGMPGASVAKLHASRDGRYLIYVTSLPRRELGRAVHVDQKALSVIDAEDGTIVKEYRSEPGETLRIESVEADGLWVHRGRWVERGLGPGGLPGVAPAQWRLEHWSLPRLDRARVLLTRDQAEASTVRRFAVADGNTSAWLWSWQGPEARPDHDDRQWLAEFDADGQPLVVPPRLGPAPQTLRRIDAMRPDWFVMRNQGHLSWRVWKRAADGWRLDAEIHVAEGDEAHFADLGPGDRYLWLRPGDPKHRRPSPLYRYALDKRELRGPYVPEGPHPYWQNPMFDRTGSRVVQLAPADGGGDRMVLRVYELP